MKKEVVVVTKRSSRPKLKAKAPKQTPKKTKKAPQSKMSNERREFLRIIQKDVENTLPEKMPWKIRIDKDILEALQDKYVGSKRSLKRVIRARLCQKTNGPRYLEAMQSASCRYGIGLEEYPLSDEDIQSCRIKLAKIKNRKTK